MHIFTRANWETSVRYMFFSFIGGLVVVVTQLIRRRPTIPARPWMMAFDALIGAASLLVANIWFNAPEFGGACAGLSCAFIIDGLIRRFLPSRRSN